MFGKQLQSLILQLITLWPIRIIGSIIWAIFDTYSRMIEAIPSKAVPGTQESTGGQAQLNSETSHLFIGLDLSLASHQQATMTEIAIPVLLPDLLDTPEATPSQFFEEHFEIYVENDTSEIMDICLVDSSGQVLFHSQPEVCPILKPWQPLTLPTGQG